MEKLFALFLSVILSLSFLDSSEKHNMRKQETNEMSLDIASLNVSDLYFQDVIDEFDRLTSAADFDVTHLPAVDLENGENSQAIIVSINGSSQTYHFHVRYNNTSGVVVAVDLRTEASTYADVPFALLSYYMYRSLGFPKTNIDEFINKYNLYYSESLCSSASIRVSY